MITVSSSGLFIEIESLGRIVSGELHPAQIFGYNPYRLSWQPQPLSVTESRVLSWTVSPGKSFIAFLKFPDEPFGYLLVIPYGVEPFPGSEEGAWATRSYNRRDNFPHLLRN